jgi:hypothetical protein
MNSDPADLKPIHNIGKCPAFTMIWSHIRQTPARQGGANDS